MSTLTNGDGPFVINPDTMPPSASSDPSRKLPNIEEESNVSYESHGISEAPSSVMASLIRPSTAATPTPTFEEWDSEHGDDAYRLKTIRSIAFSPSGQFLASGGDDHKVTIYSVLTHKKIHEREIGGAVLCISYSPNGDYVWIGGDDEKITVISMDTFSVVKTIEMSGDVETLVHSPANGHVACSGTNQTITILDWFDTRTFSVVKDIEDNSGSISHLAYSPDGKHLASGGIASQLAVYNTFTYNLSQTFEEAKEEFENSGYVTALTYAPNQKYMAVGQTKQKYRQGEKFLTVYQLPSFKVVKEMKWKMDINDVAFSSDSKLLVVVGDEKKVTIIDATTFNVKGAIIVDSAHLVVTFPPKAADHHFACGGYDGKVKLYNSSNFAIEKEYCEGMEDAEPSNNTNTVIAPAIVPPATAPVPAIVPPATAPVPAPTPKAVTTQETNVKVNRESPLTLTPDEDSGNLSDVNYIFSDIEKNQPKEKAMINDRDLEKKEQFRKDFLYLLGSAGVLSLVLGFLILVIALVR